MKRSILNISLVIVIVVSIIITFLSIIFGSVSWDATYYLPMARDISNGFVPYKDINSWYVPVMMYINAVIYYLFGSINYFWFLGFQYFITFLCGFILYKISVLYNTDKKKAVFYSVFLYVTVLLSEGIYINLEVYVMFFLLLAFYNLKKRNFILSGFLVSLSMFSKQYGVLNFIPFILYLYFFNRRIFAKGMVYFCFGAIIPILFFFSFFTLYHKVDFFSLMSQLSGEEYRDLSLSKKFSIWNLIRDSKYIVALVFPVLFVLYKVKINKTNIALLVGFLINLFPIFCQSYPHYFILTYPFLFIFFIKNHKIFNSKYFAINLVTLSIAFSVVCFRIIKNRNEGAVQLSNAEKFSKIYTNGSTVFLEGKVRYLYILNDYKNPIIKTEGYSDMFQTDEKFRAKYKTLIQK